MFDLLSLSLAVALAAQAPPEAQAPAPAPSATAEAHQVAPAVQSPAPAHEGTAAAAAGASEHAAAADGGHGGGSAAEILMHHVTDDLAYRGPFGVFPFEMSKHLFFLVVVMTLVILITRAAVTSYRNGVPKGIGAAVETLVVYVRDEIAEKNIGHGDGAKFTPLLLSFFFFILVSALFGLLPFSATATGNLSVTLPLAFVSFLAQQYAGISKYGVVKHFKNLVPHGLPPVLLIVMIPIEVLGMFTKPFALMVRLFANMLAGHMIITALLMLVPLTAGISTLFGVVMMPVALGMALFIMCLEVLVAFIQAYVFTLFSAIFIGMYAHPAH